MIVELTEPEYNGIIFWADRGYPTWQGIYDSLDPIEDDEGESTGEYRVTNDSETAQEIMDAVYEEQEAGHDPWQGVPENVAAIADSIHDHMNYGLAYGFDDDEDDEDDEAELDPDTNAVITPSGPLGSRYSASLDGRFVGEYKTEGEAIEALREAAGPNYFPDLIFVDDHGGMRLMDWD